MPEVKVGTRCEVCEGPATWCCASIDQPMGYYCDEHYIEHVRSAHHGEPLAGAARMGIPAGRAKEGR